MPPLDDERRPPQPEIGSWTEWAHHVLQELKRLDACTSEIKVVMAEIRIEQAKLQVKSGVWGALGASIPVLIGIILWALTQ